MDVFRTSDAHWEWPTQRLNILSRDVQKFVSMRGVKKLKYFLYKSVRNLWVGIETKLRKCKKIDQLEFLIRILCQKCQHDCWLIGKVREFFTEV